MVQLHGPGMASILQRLTGVADWPPARLRFVQLGDIDRGLAVVLRDGLAGWGQIMPHGGVRVVEKLLDAGIRPGDPSLYPTSLEDLYGPPDARMPSAAQHVRRAG